MMTLVSTLLHRCRQGLTSLLTCGGIMSSLLMAGFVGTPLALVSPPAMATCSMSGSLTQTYIYTAANINSAAPLPFANTWSCSNNGVVGNSQYVCYESTFGGTAVNGGSTMSYTVGLDDTLNNFTMKSGHLYGKNNNSNVLTNPVGSGTSPLAPTLTVTVPAGQATGQPAGIYTDSNIQFEFDEQGNSGACEGNFTPSSANWDAIAPVTYTANFIITGTCQLITTSKVDFGNLNQGVLAAAVNGTGGVTVNCNNGTPYTVYLGDGGQRITGSGYRQMKNGTALLAYQLYKDSAHTTIWDNIGGPTTTGGSGGVNGTGTGTNQSLTVYAQIPAGTTVPGTLGTYTDTVVVTVAY